MVSGRGDGGAHEQTAVKRKEQVQQRIKEKNGAAAAIIHYKLNTLDNNEIVFQGKSLPAALEAWSLPEAIDAGISCLIILVPVCRKSGHIRDRYKQTKQKRKTIRDQREAVKLPNIRVQAIIRRSDRNRL